MPLLPDQLRIAFPPRPNDKAPGELAILLWVQCRILYLQIEILPLMTPFPCFLEHALPSMPTHCCLIPEALQLNFHLGLRRGLWPEGPGLLTSPMCRGANDYLSPQASLPVQVMRLQHTQPHLLPTSKKGLILKGVTFSFFLPL